MLDQLSMSTARPSRAMLLQDRRTFETFRVWQVGTIGGRGYDAVAICMPFFIAGIVLALLSVRALDAYALGEDLAAGLGRKVWLDRTVIAAGAVLLAATATALAGPIAFVGLAVPHMVRRIIPARHATLLPLCFGFGAVLTLAADVVGRVIWPPTEIQVGVMTGVLCCPVLVLLLLRGRRM
ncbi:MAG: iron chelate uptake ABC transporter family permease subunit [Streptosporangiales bacterium]|nr:iron chelate uptake ABC transporter family permease subunit [Streptosporangiales bacterium]